MGWPGLRRSVARRDPGGVRRARPLRLLLDSHVLIWAVAEPARLDAAVRDALASTDNEVFVSTASIWEIAIKRASGRLTFPVDEFADLMRRMGFDILPILPAHAIAAAALPRHHGDPFDRMLIAQAIVETLELVSEDALIARYEVRLFGATKP